MAATPNVPRRAEIRKFSETIEPLTDATVNTPELIVPRYGVVTLFGFGIQVKVDRGHLVLEDGIGPYRSVSAATWGCKHNPRCSADRIARQLRVLVGVE